MLRHEIRWFFHATALVADYDKTRSALESLLGLRVLEDSLLEHPDIGRRGGLAWVGDNAIEIGEPIVVGGAAGRFVQRFGSHVSSIAVQVSDIEATLRHLESVEARLSSRIDEVIVFTDPRTTAGLAIEWFGGVATQDPRFGASMPVAPIRRLLDATHVAFVGALVDEPAVAAERLATVLGTYVSFSDPAAPMGAPKAGVSVVDMTLALYSLPPPGAGAGCWGHEYARAQTSNIGVKVPDLATALADCRRAQIPLVRHDSSAIVIDPEATGGVILVIVDELLPGDPRRELDA